MRHDFGILASVNSLSFYGVDRVSMTFGAHGEHEGAVIQRLQTIIVCLCLTAGIYMRRDVPIISNHDGGQMMF